MHTERPSLLPALMGMAAQAMQFEIGPELAGLVIALANILAATLLGILGQRLKAMHTASKQKPRQRRKKSPPQDTVLTGSTKPKQ